MIVALAIVLSAVAIFAVRRLGLSVFNPAFVFVMFIVIFTTPRLLILNAFDYQSEILGTMTRASIDAGLAIYLISSVWFFMLFLLVGMAVYPKRSPPGATFPAGAAYTYRVKSSHKIVFLALFVLSILVTMIFFRSGAAEAVDTEDFLTGTRNFGVVPKIISGLGLVYVLALSLELNRSMKKRLYFGLITLAYIGSLFLIYRASQIIWVGIVIYYFNAFMSGKTIFARSAATVRSPNSWKIQPKRIKLYAAILTAISVFIAYKFVRTGMSYGYINLTTLNAKSVGAGEIFQVMQYFIVYKGAEFSIFDSSIALLATPSNFELQEAIIHSTYGAVLSLVPNTFIEYNYEPLGKLVKTLVIGANIPGGIPLFGFSSLWASGSITLYLVVITSVSAPLWIFYRMATAKKRLGIFYPYFLLSFVNYLRIGDLSVAYTQTIFLLFIPSLVLYFSLRRTPRQQPGSTHQVWLGHGTPAERSPAPPWNTQSSVE